MGCEICEQKIPKYTALAGEWTGGKVVETGDDILRSLDEEEKEEGGE